MTLFYPTNCPHCANTSFQSVAGPDSLAPGRKGYRLCRNCGCAYRPQPLPIESLTWAMVICVGMAVAGVLGVVFREWLWGAAGLAGSLLFAWAIRLELAKFRPSTRIDLLPQDGGTPTDRLRQAFDKYRQPHIVLLNLVRQALGTFLVILGTALFLLGAGVIWNQVKPAQLQRGETTSTDLGLIGALLAAVGAGGGVSLVVFGRKLGARRAYSVLPRDHRAPILLLRSFQDDEVQLPKPRRKQSSEFETLFWSLLPSTRTYNTLENSITAAFEVIGPVVALGAPGQMVAPSGAARIWFSHADWDKYVEDLAHWAQRIILVVGDVERKGMAWEARHLLSEVARRKIVLIMPPHAQPADNRQRWDFLATLSQGRLPPYRPGTLAVYFPQPDRLLRVSLGSPTELVAVDRESLSERYEQVLVNVRDFVDNATPAGYWSDKAERDGTKGLLVECFAWPTADRPRMSPISQ